MAEKKYDIILISILFAAALIIRLNGIQDVLIYPDEALYSMHIGSIISNGWRPPDVLLRHTAILVPYTMAFVTTTYNGDIYTLRGVSAIFGSLTVCFLYLLGKTMYNRRTGFLAAILLCFSAYHILYSRLIYFESTDLFFEISSLYFFWLSMKTKKIRYSMISGALMGLAFDAKYISLFLIPATFVYVLWIEGFRSLFGKNLLITLLFALIFFTPSLICLYVTGVGLYPFYYQLFGRYEKVTVADVPVRQISIAELPIRASDDLIALLARGSEILPWANIFEYILLFLFIIILLIYLIYFLKKKREESFLFSLLATFFLLVYAAVATHKYYLIHFLPIFYLMISATFTNYLSVKIRDLEDLFRLLIVIFTLFMIVSYIVVGITSPYWEEGENSSLKKAMEYVKTDMIKDGRESVTIGALMLYAAAIKHYAYVNNINATITLIIEPTGEYSKELFIIDTKKIDTIKPDYIIAREESYKLAFNSSVKEYIYKNYSLVYKPKSIGSTVCYVFKRKVIEYRNSSKILNKFGFIIPDYFTKTVPPFMEVGKTYTVLVKVKNISDKTLNFTVDISTNPFLIYTGGEQTIRISGGSSYIFKFHLTPRSKSVKPVEITANLYIEDRGKVRINSVSDYIYFII